MTQEEKAKVNDGNYKAYTELINRLEDVKDAIKKQNYGIAMDILCKPYPDYQIITFTESEESDDERIRKALINGFNKLNKSAVWYNGITNGQILAWLEKQGEQKPNDKVEPKFKVGDWIIGTPTNNEPRQIEEVSMRGYKSTYGGWYGSSFENELHLWTIQDAKAGDVLAEDSCIFIIEKMNPNGTARVHCCLFDDGEFDLTGSTLVFNVDSTHPATKEQRDLLFQKMKENGYEWDAEKKELNKIEQKPAWSEEDKYYYNIILSLLNNECVGRADKRIAIEWFKSIKERYTWKPSEEMLEALYRVIPENVMEKSEDEMLLDKLYQGLKYGRVLSNK